MLEKTEIHAPSVLTTTTQSVNTTRDAIIDLIAGSLGGTATVLVGQPLDTVKVKLQTFPHLYKSAVNCFTQTYVQDGIRGLYAGTVPSLVANVAENSVLFAAYGICQKLVQFVVKKEKVENLTVLENAFSGFLAAFFSALTLCPTELIKCRLQAAREMSKGQTKLTIGPWDLTRKVFKEEGIMGFYRGFSSTLVREMPGYFCFFGGYEITRQLLTPPGKTKDEIGLMRTIISGAVGGVALWTVIFPADVLKSRIQISGSREKTLTILRQIVRQEGISALYSGLGPTLIRTIPATGALFVAFEYSKKYMHRWIDDLYF